MAERKISTKFEISGEQNYKKAVQSINSEMKQLNSELAKVSSEFMDSANSMEALSAKGQVLDKQLEVQRQRVDTMRNALEQAREVQQEWADKQEEASNRVQELTRELEDLKNAEGDTTEEQARLTEELKQATEAQEAANRGYEQSEKSVNYWQTRLNYAEADLNKLNAKVQENAKYLEEAKNSADGCAHSIDQYGKSAKEAGDDSDRMGNLGAAAFSKLIGSGGGGLAGLVGFAVKLVGAAKDVAVEMNNANAIMVTGTGAAGKALEELNAIYKEVMTTSKSSSDTVASVIAVLNTRLNMTGEALQENAELFEKFGRAARVDASEGVNVAADLVNTFGRNAEDIPHILDVLTVASQKSKASVLELGQAASENAFYAQELGLSLEDTVAYMAAFSNAGIDASTVGRGMKKSYDDLTASGRTWNETMNGFRAGVLTAADAVELFGTKGANLVSVLQNGKVDVDGMRDAMASAGGQMEKTAKDAETFGQKIKGWWNDLWYGGTSGSQFTGFWEFEEAAEELVDTVENDVVPAWTDALDTFNALYEASGDVSDGIDDLTEYLLTDEAQVLRTKDGYDDLVGSLNDTAAEMAALDEAVAAAKESVAANLDAVMGRFNQMPEKTRTTVDEVIAALTSQINYMDSYAYKMQLAAQKGVDDGLLQSLADGSVESDAILTGIVQATDEDIQTLNEKWLKTQEGRDTFEQTMAEIQTGFEEKSAALQAEYDAAVEHFNQYAAAESAGAETVQGVMDGAMSISTSLDAYYYQLGQSTMNSYNAGVRSVTPAQPKVMNGGTGYMAGTSSAEAGLHWVGEGGPELMLFAGGETVLNHEESMRLAREAMAAAALADRWTGADLSGSGMSVTIKSDVDVREIEALIAGVIQAVENKELIDFGAITGGVDRQLARSKKLVGLAGG